MIRLTIKCSQISAWASFDVSRERQDGAFIPTLAMFDSSCPGLSRASTSSKPCNVKGVDGRDKPGHDDVDGSMPTTVGITG
jgi:hypothetical protein